MTLRVVVIPTKGDHIKALYDAMPDGAVVATIFNQPCHGAWEGDVECWASTDGGRLWQLRGVPAEHEPRTNRMNVAAGLALLTLLSHHLVFALAGGVDSLGTLDTFWVFPAGMVDNMVPGQLAGGVTWGWFRPLPLVVVTIGPWAAAYLFYRKWSDIF